MKDDFSPLTSDEVFLRSIDYPQEFEYLSDQALLDLYSKAENRTKSREAFNAIFDRHAKSIWQYVRIRTKTKEDAEDIFAMTWCMDVLKRLSVLQIEASLKAWLTKVARHKIADFYNSRKNQSQEAPIQSGTRISIIANVPLYELLYDDDGEEISTFLERLAADEQFHPGSDPIYILLKQEEKETLHQALMELKKSSSERYEVIDLSFFKGYSNEEIAEILNKKHGAVRTMKSLAIKKLGEILNRARKQGNSIA